jgi:Flp pilus assembly protein TadG
LGWQRERGTARRSWKRQRGATLVEFALSVMLLLTLMLGVVEFGRALYAYHFTSHAARQAARWAAVNGSTCSDDSSCNGSSGMNSGYATATDIQDYAKNLAPLGMNPSDLTVTACWPSAQSTSLSCASSLATEPTSCSTYPTALGCNCYSASIGSADTDANSPGCVVEVTVNYDFHFIFPFVRAGSLMLSSTSQSIITH